VLAPPAASMRYAVFRVASSGLGAALVLAPLASAVRDAMMRAACNSRLGAALVLAPLAPAVRLAVRRAATFSPLGAALQLTLPLAMALFQVPFTPPKPQLTALRHSQPPPTPSQSASLH
jgi:hypothetical protein